MAEEIKKGNKIYYGCEECGFAYKSKELADKCEAYCKKHKSCSLEVTKHAIQLDN